jgi:hypothetical protein
MGGSFLVRCEKLQQYAFETVGSTMNAASAAVDDRS